MSWVCSVTQATTSRSRLRNLDDCEDYDNVCFSFILKGGQTSTFCSFYSSGTEFGLCFLNFRGIHVLRVIFERVLKMLDWQENEWQKR